MPVLPRFSSDRQARIVPRDKLETIGQEPIGTGPFKFKSYKPGDRVELVKNPDYFVPGHAQAGCDHIPHHAGERGAGYGAGDGRGRPGLEPASGIDRAVPEERQRHGRLGCDVDLGRRHHERGPQALRRRARTPRRRPGVGQESPGRGGVVRARQRDAHDDLADAPRTTTRTSRSRDPTSPAPRSCWRRPAIRTASRSTIFVPSGRPARERVGIAVQRDAEAGRHRGRCPARAVGQVRQGHRGQGGLLRRRLLQPADDRYLHLSLVSQQRDHGTRCCGTTRTRPWTRCWTRRAVPSRTRSAPSCTRSSRCSR